LCGHWISSFSLRVMYPATLRRAHGPPVSQRSTRPSRDTETVGQHRQLCCLHFESNAGIVGERSVASDAASTSLPRARFDSAAQHASRRKLPRR
jgi:hypothetical protein